MDECLIATKEAQIVHVDAVVRGKAACMTGDVVTRECVRAKDCQTDQSEEGSGELHAAESLGRSE